MRISDWSSDVCSSDLQTLVLLIGHINCQATHREPRIFVILHIITNVGMWEQPLEDDQLRSLLLSAKRWARSRMTSACAAIDSRSSRPGTRSEEHTSELQSLMRISYAVFCLKKKNRKQPPPEIQT